MGMVEVGEVSPHLGPPHFPRRPPQGPPHISPEYGSDSNGECGQTYYCPYCAKIFRRVIRLQQHIMFKHPSEHLRDNGGQESPRRRDKPVEIKIEGQAKEVVLVSDRLNDSNENSIQSSIVDKTDLSQDTVPDEDMMRNVTDTNNTSAYSLQEAIQELDKMHLKTNSKPNSSDMQNVPKVLSLVELTAQLQRQSEIIVQMDRNHKKEIETITLLHAKRTMALATKLRQLEEELKQQRSIIAKFNKKVTFTGKVHFDHDSDT